MNKENIPYLRVGTMYFKIIVHPLASKDETKKIVPWQRAIIDEDHGGEYRKNIPKYDSFCNIPNNIDYKRKHKNSYNLYEPIEHSLKLGDFHQIELFLKHIFGEQYEQGLDYLTIIWKHPTQILPILCLVSPERNTGKTTFLNFLKDILGYNMTINTNEDFRNQFNSGWASKLLIGVDEVMLDKKEDTERIKNLSTTRSIKSESKGRDKVEQEFYGKFILCSNNDSDFIKISPEETRFWVRKIPVIKSDNIRLRELMKKEIPMFLYFLTERAIVSPNLSRMWFTREVLFTEALQKVINGGSSKLEKEIKDLIIDMLLSSGEMEIKLIPKDILDFLKIENNVNAVKTDVIAIIQDKWKYKPKPSPEYYKRFNIHLNRNTINSNDWESRTGRYYTFKKDDFC